MTQFCKQNINNSQQNQTCEIMCTFHSSAILLLFPVIPPCALKYKQKLITQPCDIKFNETSSTKMSQKAIKKRALTYSSNTLMTTKVISKTPLDASLWTTFYYPFVSFEKILKHLFSICVWESQHFGALVIKDKIV